MRISSRLASKMRKGAEAEGGEKSWAKPVVRIATAGVALGIALIIISSAIVHGFQSEIKDLVLGFNSHIQVIPQSSDRPSVLIDDTLAANFLKIESVERVNTLHINPGLIETKKSVKGVTIKGLSDSTMVSESKVAGHLPSNDKEIIISAILANRLELELGDKLSIYIVENRESVKPRTVKLCGLYDTGLLEYDEKFVFVTPELLQNASSSGAQAVIKIDDSMAEGKVFGLNEFRETPRGRWEPHKPNLTADTSLTFMWIAGWSESADTAHLAFTAGEWETEQGLGSNHLFCNGYELHLDGFESVFYAEDAALYELPFDTPNRLRTTNVFKQSPEIFNWLGMLDINVVLIIGLMILISIINMVSALLITILEKRAEVGLLKALGLRDSEMIKTFVNYSARIIGVGFIAGNVLGFSVCLAQTSTGIITLDPTAYYISVVPIKIDLIYILGIEAIAFICCVLAMFLPAMYSTRIVPSTALRNYSGVIAIIAISCTTLQACDFPTNDPRVILGNEKTVQYLPHLENKRVAVVGNHTSVLKADLTTKPTHLVDTLLSMGVNVVKAFAPEHGFRGNKSNGAHINDGVDTATGLSILSLHGKHRKPSIESISDVDVIVFDIQDVGARFYTYLSTLLLVMECAAENDVKVVVLDRPNPHAHHVQGPMLDPRFSSFVGLAPVPIIHGMTLGEIALMANGEGWLEGGVQAELVVIECDNYSHSISYSLPIAPSPNLPSDQSIALYPSLCFLEPTAVSIGRGTPTPFEIAGFPENTFGEYEFTPVSTPGASLVPKHMNTLCRGDNFSNLETTWDLSILVGYANMFRDETGKLNGFFTSTSFFDKLAGTDKLRLYLEEGLSVEEIEKSWAQGIDDFKIARAPYLLYPQ